MFKEEPRTKSKVGQVYILLAMAGFFISNAGFAGSIGYDSNTVDDTGFLFAAKGPSTDIRNCKAETRPGRTVDGYRAITYIDCEQQHNNALDPVFTTNSPHLRLDILLTRMEQKVVHGSGIFPVFPANLYGDINISSQSASITNPNAHGFLSLASISTDLVNEIEPYPIYGAIIENGCIGTPEAEFNLTLVSRILHGMDSIGALHLHDDVVGKGYYKFKFTVRADMGDGNVSDYIFSGDANSTCTGQLSF